MNTEFGAGVFDTEPEPAAFKPLTTDNQTVKQPVVWRCPNPECREISTAKHYEFTSDYGECPKCGCQEPHVRKRALIHLLLKDRKGPIVGDLGIRWKMACDVKRTHLATHDNGEAATGDSNAANCPGCLKATGGKLVVNGTALSLNESR